MNIQHEVIMSPQKYPGGLRIFTCRDCRYAFAAEVNEWGIVQFETKVSINHGDTAAVHGLFQVYDEPPTLSFSGESAQLD